MNALWFLLAAAGGTAVRTVLLSLNDEVPWGTLAVNLGGSFLLGLLVGADATPVAVTVGGVGSLTTWSRFAAGLVERRDQTRNVALYLLISLVGGVGLAWAGLRLAG